MTFDELAGRLDVFRQYYDTKILPDLNKLAQKQAKMRVLSWTVVIVAVLCVFFIFLLTGNDSFTIGAAAVFAVVFIILFAVMSKNRRQAKLLIMPALCDHLNFNYRENPNTNLLAAFEKLSLIPSYDKKKIEDQISGSVENVEFNVFEARLEDESTDHKGRKTSVIVFNGVLARFEFPKPFKETTIISQDITRLGNFLSGWLRTGERVKLEDPIFESKFEVYSTNQVEARYLLTPALMERINRLSDHGSINDLELAFYNGHLYMSIERWGNLFDGGGHRLNSVDHVESAISDLSSMYDIIRELNLSQKTKI